MPPISGPATLHFVVNMVEDLIATIRLLVTEAPVEEEKVGGPAPRPLSPSVEGAVLRVVRANPNATRRVVQGRMSLMDANAKQALTTATLDRPLVLSIRGQSTARW